MNAREEMIQQIKLNYHLDSPRVFSAMLAVPRHRLLPRASRHLAYRDAAVPVGSGQTISQPYTVAFMTDLLALKGHERVLELGTGSGYQAAVLSHLAKEVYTIERLESLARSARRTLKRLGYHNVHVKWGRGELGWPQHAPYDAIIVTANLSKDIPPALLHQLASRAVLVAPVNGQMIKLIKRSNKLKREHHGRFSFVPFIES